ncbi:hypothetical protein HDU76_010710, partial [Blyttiomyces sp. JEL0837]
AVDADDELDTDEGVSKTKKKAAATDEYDGSGSDDDNIDFSALDFTPASIDLLMGKLASLDFDGDAGKVGSEDGDRVQDARSGMLERLVALRDRSVLEQKRREEHVRVLREKQGELAGLKLQLAKLKAVANANGGGTGSGELPSGNVVLEGHAHGNVEGDCCKHVNECQTQQGEEQEQTQVPASVVAMAREGLSARATADDNGDESEDDDSDDSDGEASLDPEYIARVNDLQRQQDEIVVLRERLAELRRLKEELEEKEARLALAGRRGMEDGEEIEGDVGDMEGQEPEEESDEELDEDEKESMEIEALAERLNRTAVSQARLALDRETGGNGENEGEQELDGGMQRDELMGVVDALLARLLASSVEKQLIEMREERQGNNATGESSTNDNPPQVDVVNIDNDAPTPVQRQRQYDVEINDEDLDKAYERHAELNRTMKERLAEYRKLQERQAALCERLSGMLDGVDDGDDDEGLDSEEGVGDGEIRQMLQEQSRRSQEDEEPVEDWVQVMMKDESGVRSL